MKILIFQTVKLLYRYLATGVLCLFLTSCALYTPSTTQNYSKVCAVPTDQSSTLSGKWAATPIPLAFHTSAFSEAEVSAAIGAADTWNEFFTASKSTKTLDYGTSATQYNTSNTPSNATASDFCASAILQGTTFTGNVIIYKLTTWPTSYNSSAIALTSFCTYSASPYKKIYNAVIEVNYSNFFTTSKQPDLRSVILHELGHLHGLGHSCESGGGSGIPNCSDSNLSTDYLTAIMYPKFNFDQNGIGAIKHSLQKNDQERANCLY